MPVISDEDVIALVRKEFERRIEDFCEKHGIERKDDQEEMKSDDEENDDDEEEKPKKSRELSMEKLSAGLRIRHKESGLEYPIADISPDLTRAILRTAEGNSFPVSAEELETEYELD